MGQQKTSKENFVKDWALPTLNFIILDCDGVILDSNRIKSRAIVSSLGDGISEEKRKIFLDYHRAHGGITRQRKFEFFYQDVMKCENVARAVSEACRRYASILRQELPKASLVPRIRKLLEFSRKNRIRLFVISGAETNEVERELRSRKLDTYFDEIMGGPRSKNDHIASLRAQQLFEGRGIFFGDAKADLLASIEAECEFVFVSGQSEWRGGEQECLELGHRVIADFSELFT